MKSSPPPAAPYLHNLADFKDLLDATAEARGVLPQLVEKDYWIMHCLYGLKQSPLTFEMKGGTSLSKGFGIIDRFSEDIDIRIDHPADLPIKSSQTKPNYVAKRRAFIEGCMEHFRQIPGLMGVEYDDGFTDAYYRHIGVKLLYPSQFQALSALKTGVLLEIGFGKTTPNQPRQISAWAFEQALAAGFKAGKDMIDNRAVEIPCYELGYTFVEKLQAVSTKYRFEREGKGMPGNFLRHYYDLHALLAHADVLSFIGTEAYYTHKQNHFRTDDNLNIRENAAFSLADPEVFARYEEEYARIRDLFYREPPSLRAILARLAEHMDRL